MVDDASIHTSFQKAVDGFKDPLTGRPISKTGQLRNVRISDGHVQCELALATHSLPIAQETIDRFVDYLRTKIPDVQAIDVQVVDDDRPIPAIGQVGLNVRSVIAVAAGKGGVGKSTVAASLAIMLKKLGARVGLMDADVYGPSIPTLMGVNQRPMVSEGKIDPIDCNGMPIMSMGFLIERNQAVVWRGPMLHGSITQFLKDTRWGPLDYLIIDMPPGTGDVALTLSQLLPLSGAVIVCTPQEVALLDAEKAIAMFCTVKIPILGMVENMSGFTCPDTGKTWDIFGRGGARECAQSKNIPFLGELPIHIEMREKCDVGQLADALDNPMIAAPIEKVTRALVRSLADQAARSSSIAAPLPVLS
jgi:ATP-binding protein involved in chromosome partitioning